MHQDDQLLELSTINNTSTFAIVCFKDLKDRRISDFDGISSVTRNMSRTRRSRALYTWFREVRCAEHPMANGYLTDIK
jgi:hypothetical protein